MATPVSKTTVVIGNVKAPENGNRGTIGITIYPPKGDSFRLSASCHRFDSSDSRIYQNSVTAIIPAGGKFDTHEDNSSGTCEYTWFTHEIPGGGNLLSSMATLAFGKK